MFGVRALLLLFEFEHFVAFVDKYSRITWLYLMKESLE